MSFYFAFVYDPVSGRILRRVTCSDAELSFYDPAIATTDPEAGRWDDSTHWVVDGQLVERPVMSLEVDKTVIEADGVDQAMITGIPSGATVRIDGQPDEVVHDGTVSFGTEVAGEYRLRFEAFPHRDAEIVVTAT